MDEILKLAKYVTLHIAIIEKKWDISAILCGEQGLSAEADIQKLLKIALQLDAEIENYLKRG